MERIKSIEISSSIEEDNIAYSIEENITNIEYEITQNWIKLLVTEENTEKSEIIVPLCNIGTISIIK